MKREQVKVGKLFALVSPEDMERISAYKWRPTKVKSPTGRIITHYAIATVNGGQTCVFMHRIVLGLERGNPLQADHINHDGLDNRRENLRICTAAQNATNRVFAREHPGVYWSKQDQRWVARIKRGGRVVWTRYLRDKDEAIALLKVALSELNHPEGGGL